MAETDGKMKMVYYLLGHQTLKQVIVIGHQLNSVGSCYLKWVSTDFCRE